MKTRVLSRLTIMIALIALAGAGAMGQGIQIHYFNFNQNTPATDENWAQPVAATIGSGTLTYSFTRAVSFAGTAINGNEGEVNGGSFCPQGGTENENNGKHFDLLLSTAGYENIVITYPTRRTSTGFTTHAVFYTVDGEEWVAFDTFDISAFANNWAAEQFFTLNFSEIEAVNDNPEFALRFVLTGVTSTAGNNRFDNISVRGNEAGTTGIETIDAGALQVYPNPAHTILYVQSGIGIDQVTLIDMSGKTVYEAREIVEASGVMAIDVSGFIQGVYLLRAVSGNQVFSQKIQLGW